MAICKKINFFNEVSQEILINIPENILQILKKILIHEFKQRPTITDL